MDLSKLLIWKRAIELADDIYRESSSFPPEERYGLTSQMRRAAVSIPSNIAEGSQRTSNKEFANFILIAKGSLAELQTQVLLSKRFGFMPEEREKTMQEEIGSLHRMLHAFHSKLITRDSKLATRNS